MSLQAPSFERIDYSLRTNKSIERKLVFECLKQLSSLLDFTRYGYLGFGSLWFVDFVMAHRKLGIEKLCSIERRTSADRAEFNKPYFCIDVCPGDASEVLVEMAQEEWSAPKVVWLDYDGRFDADARDDCRLVLERAKVGTVLIVTANAHRGSYRRGSVDTAPPTVQVLRDLLGDSVPATLPPGSSSDVAEADFPAFLAASVTNFLGSVVRNSGRETDDLPDRFIPLFEFIHRDGVPMTTVGGVVVSWRMLQAFESHFQIEAKDLFQGGAMKKDVLDIVPITLKEKLALDGILPGAECDVHKRAVTAGIRLGAEQISKYRRLYPHFPLFGEMGV